MFSRFEIEDMSLNHTSVTLDLDPVSYTHLDVYKRQVLLQLPMFSRIGGRVGIDRCCSQFLFGSAHIVGTVFNAVPDHIHVAGLQLFKITVHISQWLSLIHI